MKSDNTRNIFMFTLLVLLASLPQIFGNCSADVEPNNTVEEAENMVLNQTVLGSLDSVSDDYDFYNISFSKGQDIVAVLDGPDDADFDMKIRDSGYNEVAGSTSDSDAEEVVFYTPPTSGHYFVELWAYDGNGSYTLEVAVPETTPHGTYRLAEAESEKFITVKITGVFEGSEGTFNLETGEDVFYGKCINIQITSLVANQLDIVIPAGQLLKAHSQEVEDKVVTKDTVVHVEALNVVDTRLYAMSTNMVKKVPNTDSTFKIDSMAAGDLKKVVDELNTTDSQSVSGQIAVWMVTNDAQKSELTQLGANESAIDAGLEILTNAGVTPPFRDENGVEPGLMIYLGLMLIVILLIAVLALLSARHGKKQKEETQEIQKGAVEPDQTSESSISQSGPKKNP
ncbi:MAG: PPC domain-containing protein [Thermoplasmata archaeon]|nr:MAG: PPC domain-containing protein [Thermoplasmata archaeon]